MDAASLVAGLVTVTLWGSAFVAIRDAGEAMAPGALALGRVLVSSAILRAIALARREPLPSRRDLAVIGAFGTLWLGVYSVALNEAERHVDAGAAAMLVGSGPLLIALLAGIFLREGFPRRLFSGCAIAFVGSSIIGFATSQAGSNVALGIALLFIAVLARVSAFQVTWLGCAAATLALLPFAPSLIQDMQSAGETAIGLTIYLGIFPTAIGFATWSFALRRTSAGQMGAMLYLIPIVAVLLSWAILSEMPPWLAVAGGALSLGGVYLARRD
ncbi:DMT family transporter [Candidatus Acetothermia bacterium]|nr:DMT family transporter [Candidatus Acetothermia bacterium]MBI3643367.1 DMT family transporter [Candidatus Acetothermia bacterium]